MDVMLDLETLGTRPDAVILQIGAVLFEPRSGGKVLNGKGFKRHVLLQDGCGTIDHSTLCFWLTEPGAAAMGRALRDEAVPLSAALADFCTWPKDVEDLDWEVLTVWSNGAAFDQPILASAFARFGMTPPWHFRNSECCRTLFRRVGGPPEVDWTGLVKHDALDDAIGQAMQVQKAFGLLTGRV